MNTQKELLENVIWRLYCLKGDREQEIKDAQKQINLSEKWHGGTNTDWAAFAAIGCARIDIEKLDAEIALLSGLADK